MVEKELLVQEGSRGVRAHPCVRHGEAYGAAGFVGGQSCPHSVSTLTGGSLCDAVGRPELKDDPRFAELPTRREPIEGTDGLRTVDSPIKLDSAKRPAGKAPAIGEYTEEILAELGYSAERIEALCGAGVVAVPG